MVRALPFLLLCAACHGGAGAPSGEPTQNFAARAAELDAAAANEVNAAEAQLATEDAGTPASSGNAAEPPAADDHTITPVDIH